MVLVLGAALVRGAGGLRLGHFAAMRWADPDQPTTDESDGGVAVRMPEVFVGGEGLARGPAEMFGTLLHEAAHGLGSRPRDQGHVPAGSVAQRPVQGAGRGSRDRGHKGLDHRLVKRRRALTR